MPGCVDVILIGTGNRGKFEEIVEILGPLPVTFFSLQDLPGLPPAPPETGITYEENAKEKAVTLARAAKMWTLADDSGLEVEALGGKPGVHSARFGGTGLPQEMKNQLILRMLQDTPPEKRKAQFICVAALSSPDGDLQIFHASCSGMIVGEPRGLKGFGYDPLFYLPDLHKTMAELSLQEKNSVSHRGKAFRQARESISRLLARPDCPGHLPSAGVREALE